ncbi:MAG: type VI secretion system contractile sheath large subunit [Planctomycetaceae bacterium]
MPVSAVFGAPLPDRRPKPKEPSETFRILVLGNFGSSTAWGKPVAVDRDNLDDVIQRLGVTIRLNDIPDAGSVNVSIGEMEDFHPDRLYQQLDLFESLRNQRQRLQNSETFAAESAAIMAAQAKSDVAQQQQQPAGTDEASAIDPADLLQRAMEQTEAERPEITQSTSIGGLDIDELVRRIVAPYVLQKADPRQAEFVAAVDDAIAQTMRRVLHDPAFQQVEASWQGIRLLTRRLPTDASLQISLMPVSKQQLADDLMSTDDLTRTKLHDVLVDQTSVIGTEPWTLVVGNYTFENSEADTDMLGRVARIHSAAGSVFLSAASPQIVGCDNLRSQRDPHEWTAAPADAAKRWQTLRDLPQSASIALAMPRILIRRAYGEETDPIESFRFEEIPDGTVHNDYLWLNPAFAAATLLGQSFSQAGWDLMSAWSPELDGLPIHFYSDDDDTVMQPVAEVELVLRAGDVLSAAGLTAVHSVRDQGCVLIPALTSLSSAGGRVTDRWM